MGRLVCMASVYFAKPLIKQKNLHLIGGVCSACILLFAAGSRKIASTGAFIGVHGAADSQGSQTAIALAATTLLAKDLAAYGVPASVIGRMVTTPPEQLSRLSPQEIEMFPWGTVQKFELEAVPIALSGLDSEVRQGMPPRAAPAYQKAGPSLPISPPPRDTFGSAPTHSPELMQRAKDYSAGFVFGESSMDKAACSQFAGSRRDGCLSGIYTREKLDSCLRAKRDTQPDFAALEQEACDRQGPYKIGSAESYARGWIESYDDAYTTKTRDGNCGNGASPENDGCRAGATAWHRTEAKQ